VAGQDVAGGITPDAASFPGSEEFRMVRAIALLALMEAARHGEYRATFRGFRVEALRQCPAGADAFVDVHLCVSLGRTVVERGNVATSNAGAAEPLS
jgi:hypothetical protein